MRKAALIRGERKRLSSLIIWMRNRFSCSLRIEWKLNGAQPVIAEVNRGAFVHSSLCIIIENRANVCEITYARMHTRRKLIVRARSWAYIVKCESFRMSQFGFFAPRQLNRMKSKSLNIIIQINAARDSPSSRKVISVLFFSRCPPLLDWRFSSIVIFILPFQLVTIALSPQNNERRSIINWILLFSDGCCRCCRCLERDISQSQ